MKNPPSGKTDEQAKRRAAARDEKDARLKAALRENLRRRKRQQSGRRETEPDSGERSS